MFTNLKKKLRRLLATIISALLVINVVMPVEAKAQTPESPYDPITHLENAYSYAYGGLLDLRLLYPFLTKGKGGPALDAAELQGVEQLWESIENNGLLPKGSTLDLRLLQLIYVNLGQLSIPLLGEDGLLEFVLTDTSVGVLREHAHAPYSTTAQGGVGVVSDSGSLEVTQPGEGANATVDLLSLLNLRTSDFITQTLIKEASLSLGAVSAVAKNAEFDNAGQATCENATLFDYEALRGEDLDGNSAVLKKADETLCSGYQVADAMVVIDAPAVKNVYTALEALLTTTQTALNSSLGEGGVLVGLVDALLGIKAEITLPVDDIIGDLVGTPLTSSDELVRIDLSTGTISINLKKLHSGNPDGLNSLDPNTSLITDTELAAITKAITNLLTAGANDEPNGLNARIDRLVRGEKDELGDYTYRGGVYASEVSIEICQRGLISGECVSLTKAVFTTKLGGLLTGAEEGSRAEYDASPYDYYVAEGLLGTVVGLALAPLLGSAGTIINSLLFADGTGLLGGLQSTVLSPLLNGLSPLLEWVLDPLASVIINRQTLREVAHGSVLTVSAVEVNVLGLGTEIGKLVHLPLATAAVMAQTPVTLDFDVAKVGDGRELHTGGYSYNLICRAEEEYIPAEGLDPEKRIIDVLSPTEPLSYPKDNIGSGFSFDFLTPEDTSKQLYLTGAQAGGLGLTTPLRIMPGAECTVTIHEELLPHQALRPTGEEQGTRTPYTYFLYTDGDIAFRSGEVAEDGITTMDPIADFENGQVPTDIETVGEQWKTHSYTFVVPTGKDIHRVSIVHAYDIDTRDITLSKTTTGPAPEGQSYSFQYSLDEGNPWLPQSPDSPISVAHGGSFTIKDVPVLDLQSLNAEPPTQVSTEIKIRELVESDSQHVMWELDGATLNSEYESDGTVQYALTRFTAGPVADAAIVPTPDDMIVGVTNSYVEVSVDKHIDGLLSVPLSDTTLLPFGEDEMTIRYTVTTTENPGSVTLSDPSLNNDLFDLPAGFNVGTDGTIHDCTLTAVAGEDNTYSCEFTVTFSAPEAPFHYEAADAVVTATVTKTIDGRTVTATATDQHGAMRLPNIFGQLPATGVTTLVWVMALGLIAALTALALYVRSRRK
ncbi:hypothetical protein FM102_04080 [Corynebacterium glutamicum]|uniref:choice-of-anchor G family protein n=1 Tax=Corynebacterium glutamicum TaxID=1718 RepID=UPI00097F6797|nr:choice-of-anchor G family protein [Corynebacterium glutamicum]SJM51328.1 hypothetical protein FM102_04080 [Corynebacterium glutamicum]